MAIIRGTEGRDTLRGTPEADTIFGLGGGDDILAKAGNDTVRGGDGFDIIRGELGDDRLFGEADGAFIVGGRGNDLAAGGPDTDRFSDEADGADGNDSYDGGAGFDDIEFRNDAQAAGVRLTLGANGAASRAVQGTEVDTVRRVENVDGTDAADFIAGNNLRNSLRGLDGADRLEGRGGNDFLSGEAGNDRLLGGDGADTLLDSAGIEDDGTVIPDGSDLHDGGAGRDLVAFGNGFFETAGLRLTLGTDGAASQARQGAETNTVRNVEDVEGTGLADTIVGNNLANRLDGSGGGGDRLEGRGGNDFLTGGGELDDARFGRSLTIDAGTGNDEIVGVGAVERTLAGTGADKVTSSLDPFDFPARVDTVDLGADRQSDTLTQLVELFPVDTDTPAYGFGVDRVTNFRAEDKLAVEFILDPERVNVADRLDSDGNGRVDDADQDVRLEGRDLVLDLDAVIRQVPLGEFLPEVDQHVVLVNTVSFDADQLI